MTFSLDDEAQKKFTEWSEALPPTYTGAIGGRFTFSFTPNSLGTVIKVKDDVTQQELDLTDYDW